MSSMLVFGAKDEVEWRAEVCVKRLIVWNDGRG